VAYANDDSAASAAGRKLSEIRRKCERTGLPELLWEQLGVGMKEIVKAIGEGLEAEIVKPMVLREEKVVRVKGPDGKERDQVIRTERIVEMGPYPDGRTRVDAARVAAQLRGDIRTSRPAGEERQDPGKIKFVFNILGGPARSNPGG
jgi:hypothetical protein